MNSFLLFAIIVAIECSTSLKFIKTKSGSDLTSIDKLRAYLSELNDVDARKWQTEVKFPLDNLKQLISFGNDNVCSKQKLNDIREFFDKYIHIGQTSLIPDKLRRVFIAYGLLVSSVCSAKMIETLQKLDDKQILKSNEDEILLDDWVGKRSTLAFLLRDNLVMPYDMLKVAARRLKQDKIFVQTAFGQSLARLQSVCLNQLESIYSELVMPVVKLSDMGFNYVGSQMTDTKSIISRWYRITYLCESLKSIQFIRDHNFEQRNPTIFENKRIVRLVTQQESETLEQIAEIDGNADETEDAIKVTAINSRISLQGVSSELSAKDFKKLLEKFDQMKLEYNKSAEAMTESLARYMLHMLYPYDSNVLESPAANGAQTKKELLNLLNIYSKLTIKKIEPRNEPAGSSLFDRFELIFALM